MVSLSLVEHCSQILLRFFPRRNKKSWMSPCFDVIFMGAHSGLGNPFEFFITDCYI